MMIYTSDHTEKQWQTLAGLLSVVTMNGSRKIPRMVCMLIDLIHVARLKDPHLWFGVSLQENPFPGVDVERVSLTAHKLHKPVQMLRWDRQELALADVYEQVHVDFWATVNKMIEVSV